MSLWSFLGPRSWGSCLLSAPLLLAACNDTDPLPVFFDLNYQVGCVLPECRAGAHSPQRIVTALDGENGFSNTCNAQNVGGAMAVSLRSSNGNSQSFAITGALVGVEGNVGTSCVVEIIEGDIRFRGACSTNLPTAQAPCQLTGFGKNTNGLLEGKLYCNDIRGATAPDIIRDVAKAGTFGNCRNESGQLVDQSQCPAEFLIEPCEGL